MKRSLSSLLALAPLLLFSGLAWSAEPAGEIVSVRGEAVVERDGSSLPARTSLSLLEADAVATRENGRVKMLFRDDSLLTLAPSSRLIIRQYLFSPADRRARSIYQLIDGKVRAVVGSPDFQVTTPTAFAAARGTIFAAWYDRAGDFSGVGVSRGKVLVRNIDPAVGGEIVLQAGEMVIIPRGAPPQEPVPYREDELTGEVAEEELGAVILSFPPGPPPAEPGQAVQTGRPGQVDEGGQESAAETAATADQSVPFGRSQQPATSDLFFTGPAFLDVSQPPIVQEPAAAVPTTPVQINLNFPAQ